MILKITYFEIQKTACLFLIAGCFSRYRNAASIPQI